MNTASTLAIFLNQIIKKCPLNTDFSTKVLVGNMHFLKLTISELTFGTFRQMASAKVANCFALLSKNALT